MLYTSVLFPGEMWFSFISSSCPWVPLALNALSAFPHSCPAPRAGPAGARTAQECESFHLAIFPGLSVSLCLPTPLEILLLSPCCQRVCCVYLIDVATPSKGKGEGEGLGRRQSIFSLDFSGTKAQTHVYNPEDFLKFILKVLARLIAPQKNQ